MYRKLYEAAAPVARWLATFADRGEQVGNLDMRNAAALVKAALIDLPSDAGYRLTSAQVEELAASWINGNRTTVADEVLKYDHATAIHLFMFLADHHSREDADTFARFIGNRSAGFMPRSRC